MDVNLTKPQCDMPEGKHHVLCAFSMPWHNHKPIVRDNKGLLFVIFALNRPFPFWPFLNENRNDLLKGCD